MPRLLQIRLVVLFIVYRELRLCEEALSVHRRELPIARGERACDAWIGSIRQKPEAMPMKGRLR